MFLCGDFDVGSRNRATLSNTWKGLCQISIRAPLKDSCAAHLSQSRGTDISTTAILIWQKDFSLGGEKRTSLKWLARQGLAASSPPVTTVTRVQRALVSHEVEPLRPEFRSSCGCELKSLTTQPMLRRCVYEFFSESPSTWIIEKQRSGFYRD